MFDHRGVLSALVASGALLTGCSDDAEQDCAGRSNVYAGSVQIDSTENSTHLSDLECTEVISGSLSLKHLSEKSLEPLGKLVRVMGDLEIGDQFDPEADGYGLQSLHGLERLEQVDGDLSISGLWLSSVKALHALKQVGGDLSLEELPSIKDFIGLESLESVGGDLSITQNDQLANLDAFESLRQIYGKFTLDSNPMLTSATFGSGEEFLAPTIAGMIFVAYNDSLKDLSGFGYPKGHDAPCAPLDTDVVVTQNASLETLVLPSATTKVCYSVSHNPNLTIVSEDSALGSGRGGLELVELPSLTSVSFSLWQFDNLWIHETGLGSLDGFEHCLVRCNLQVTKNPALTDISFLQESGPYAVQFSVRDNPALATCQVQSVVGALRAPDEVCVLGGELSYGWRDVDVSGNNDTAVCQ